MEVFILSGSWYSGMLLALSFAAIVPGNEGVA